MEREREKLGKDEVEYRTKRDKESLELSKSLLNAFYSQLGDSESTFAYSD